MALPGAIVGCDSEPHLSIRLATEELQRLSQAATEDVRQIRTGLPLGAKRLIQAYKEGNGMDPQTARTALEDTREHIADLRVAKSTFFALVTPEGTVIRTDQEQDRLAGKSIFTAFPELKQALTEPYVETRGSMPEAAEVRGRGDGQWVAAAPIRDGASLLGLYVTGFSWSAYAYRLENSARSTARSALAEGGKLPLIYAFVVVGDAVYGAPISPDVNAKAVHDQAVLQKASVEKPLAVGLEITGRSFGLAAAPVPALGDHVAIAVLRSET